jgi:nucleoside-diphosphate-sugar epimerase
VYGYLKDPAALDAVLDGIDTTITTAIANQRDEDDSNPAGDLQETLNLIEAAKAAGVRRLVTT